MSEKSITQTQQIALTEERRSLHWVDPSFQKRYAFFLVAVVLTISLMMIFAFWFHSERVLATVLSAGIAKNQVLYQLIQKQMSYLLWSVCGVVGLFSVFVFLFAAFLSHRIVGPLFAIKRNLEQLGKGDYAGAKIQLRADDEFHDVATLINNVVDQIESKK